MINFLKQINLSAYFPYLGICIVIASTFTIHQSGDTQALLIGVNNAINCLSNAPIVLPCGPGVIHFPIFQYLISAPFNLSGVSNGTIIKILGWMSLAWFLIASAAFWRAGYISAAKPGGHLGLLILISSYLLWYISSSFNEAASFALFALLVLSILDNWGILKVCILALICTITKEVAFPFVLYFMFIAFFSREYKNRQIKNYFSICREFIYIYKLAILSVLAGIAINFGFNYFRYGSIKNLFNLDPALHTPPEYILDFLVFLFISPAAGLLFSWFSISILIIISLILLVRDRIKAMLILLTLIGLVFVNIGLANWYSPFGYNAWGPRLTLPFLGSIAILIIYLTATQTINFIKKMGRGGVLICFIVFAISSLPNIAVRLDGNAFFTKMFAPTNIEISSAIKSFTIQTVPIKLYMDASVEAYSRNILIPTTTKIISANWSIIILWLMSIFYICRQLIFPLKNTNKDFASSEIKSSNIKYEILHVRNKFISFGLFKNIILIMSVILLLSNALLSTRNQRESCPFCFDLWHKFKLGEAVAEYHLIAPQRILVTGLDNFPANLPLAKILIKLKKSEVIESISINAIDKNGNDLGNWVTQPISYLWGIGILDGISLDQINNGGLRTEKLNLPTTRELSLLIPDNGNLSKHPYLYIKISLHGGRDIGILATYKEK
jgi:hypothetical protein